MEDLNKQLNILCRRGDVNGVKEMLENTNVNIHHNGECAFNIAVTTCSTSGESTDLVKFLLSLEGENRINFNNITIDGEIAPIENLIDCNMNLELLKLFLSLEGDRYINIHYQDEYIFCNLCGVGKIKMVKHLLTLTGDRKIDIHVGDDRCFRWACKNSQLKMIKFLASLDGENRINVNSRNNKGILNCGFFDHRHIEILKYFLTFTGDRYIDLSANDYYLFIKICEKDINKNKSTSALEYLLSLKGERKIKSSIVNKLNIKEKYRERFRMKILIIIIKRIYTERRDFMNSYKISKQTVKNKRIVLNHLKSIPTGEFYDNFPGGSDYLKFLNKYS